MMRLRLLSSPPASASFGVSSRWRLCYTVTLHSQQRPQQAAGTTAGVPTICLGADNPQDQKGSWTVVRTDE